MSLPVPGWQPGAFSRSQRGRGARESLGGRGSTIYKWKEISENYVHPMSVCENWPTHTNSLVNSIVVMFFSSFDEYAWFCEMLSLEAGQWVHRNSLGKMSNFCVSEKLLPNIIFLKTETKDCLEEEILREFIAIRLFLWEIPKECLLIEEKWYAMGIFLYRNEWDHSKWKIHG